MYILKHAVSIN